MGKKKGKKRAAEAAAAAMQRQTPGGTPAVNGLTLQYPPVNRFSDRDQGSLRSPTISSSHMPWPTMDASMVVGGIANKYPMPQTMNGLQTFNMPLLQSNFFATPQFTNMYGMSIGLPGSSMSFSTMQPNMFPGQPPAPAFGQYALPQRAMGENGHVSTHCGDINATTGPWGSHGEAAAAANAADASTSAKASRSNSPMNNIKNMRSAITAPSKASGGIPNPTPLYLARASFLPKRRPEPGPLLVVIDLNGTLLYRPDKKKPHSFLRRPHADRFVRYCIETFWVVIWSSARPDNVNRMVQALVSPEHLLKVVAVWGRDRFGLTHDDYDRRTQCYKRLTTLWNDPEVKSSFPADRPGCQGKCWDQGNTVLIDDSVEKARSEPHNAITIPEFTGDLAEIPDILPKVHDYLNELCFQEDVSTYVRANPFKMA